MKLKLIIAFIISIGFHSCFKNNEYTTLKKDLSYFSEIVINSPCDVYLIEDSVFEIEIKGYERNVENFEFIVSDSILTLTNLVGNKFLTPEENKIEIFIKSKPLKKAIANETCNIKTITPISSSSFGLVLKSKSNQATLELNCEKFHYWNNFPCGGLLTLSGQTKSLKIWNYGLMRVDAENLEANKALVHNHSKADCNITVKTMLEYSITNVGNINLFNRPNEVIKDEVTSSGRLVYK